MRTPLRDMGGVVKQNTKKGSVDKDEMDKINKIHVVAHNHVFEEEDNV